MPLLKLPKRGPFRLVALETAENCKILAVDGSAGTWYADPEMQEKFIEMGDIELSMATCCVLESGKRICECEQ